MALVRSGSKVKYAPCSVCLTDDIISCSIFGSKVITLVVSFAGKNLFEIALFRLWRTYSVRTSVSLVTAAWSASVSKIVKRSRMEIPSLNKFCNTFCTSPRPSNFGMSSSTRTGLLSFRLLTRFCTSCLVKSSAIWFRITSVRCVAIMDGGSTTVYPRLSALSLWLSVIQIAGRWKDGSKVGIPVISSSTYPGFIAI